MTNELTLLRKAAAELDGYKFEGTDARLWVSHVNLQARGAYTSLSHALTGFGVPDFVGSWRAAAKLANRLGKEVSVVGANGVLLDGVRISVGDDTRTVALVKALVAPVVEEIAPVIALQDEIIEQIVIAADVQTEPPPVKKKRKRGRPRKAKAE